MPGYNAAMEWFEAVILALVQGVTEFLPVSSQAHLVLYSLLTGGAYQGLDFDIVLHAGSLIAVVVYFRRELCAMAGQWLGSLTGGPGGREAELAWWLIIATLPAVVFGLLLKGVAEQALRSPPVMAAALIGFGLLLGWADWARRGERDEYTLRLPEVLLIGLAQVLALIPGTSRSGITMTAGLLVGLSREASARFSFLLSVPIIAAAGLLAAFDLSRADHQAGLGALCIGLAVSIISTYACIHAFLAFIRRIGMQPFVAYRVILGMLLLAFWL